MNVFEGYTLSVSEALARGETVPTLSGSNIYIVEISNYDASTNRWFESGSLYFGSRKSAENGFRSELYRSTCEVVKKYRDEVISLKGIKGWQEDNNIFLRKVLLGVDGDNLLGHFTANGFESRIFKKHIMVDEITKNGQSEELLHFFIQSDFQELNEWHEDRWTNANDNRLRRTRYIMRETRKIDFCPISSTTSMSALAPGLSKDISATPHLDSLHTASDRVPLDYEEEVQVALLLGAEFDALPGTTFTSISLRRGWGREKSHNALTYGQIYLSRAEDAEYACIAYELRKLLLGDVPAPWAWAPLFAEMSVDEWYQKASLWLVDRIYEDLLAITDKLRVEGRFHEGLALQSCRIEEAEIVE